MSSFTVQVADRVKRLPPYLFGKINELKYRMRKQGADIIDLGMGNPRDVPDPMVIDKLCEAARDEKNHGYSVSNGLKNLRNEISKRYERKHGVSSILIVKYLLALVPKKYLAICVLLCSALVIQRLYPHLLFPFMFMLLLLPLAM